MPSSESCFGLVRSQAKPLGFFVCLFVGCARSLLLCAGFSLVVARGGSSLVLAHRRLTAGAPLVSEHGLQATWAP